MHFTMSENALARREAGISLDQIRSKLANASSQVEFYTPYHPFFGTSDQG